MLIDRDSYLSRLISHQNNGRVKIITGIRRCGKSYLLFTIFKSYLISHGVDPQHIIEIAFDDRRYKSLRDPDICYNYVTEQIDENSNEQYYVLLDEVQMMDEFVDVINGFLHIKNADVYVTGSNSQFLSKDVATEFRGRGDEIRMYPLSFSEYHASSGKNWEDDWNMYYTYGGLPYVLQLDEPQEKISYLENLFSETYLRDIIDRHHVRNDEDLDILVDIIASGIGSLTNPRKLANTFKSNGYSKISEPTVKKYLDYLEDAFLIASAKRYDVKGKRYISTPLKYYFEDIGLRNAKLHFRQQEETHIMENIIFNELRFRGYFVDVGMVEVREESKYKQVEIDFIANRGTEKYYIQSALHLDNTKKEKQEIRPFLNIDDSFKKIIIVRDNIMRKQDDNGIITMGIREFLLDQDSLID